MLKVSDINVYYGSIYAVKDVSFEVKQGEIVTLIGANGAGKSTILRTVSGLMRSRTGSIAFENREIGNMPPHSIVQLGLAHVPEGRRIFLRMTVRENLEMGNFTQSGTVMQEGLEEVFERFPRLRERERQVAGTLSGGEQQMLAIGRGLMSAPKLLLMDEPSMGIAPLIVRDITKIIKSLHADGTTILLVEQNAKMALGLADYGYVMDTGSIVLEGKGSDLRKDEKVVSAYLGG